MKNTICRAASALGLITGLIIGLIIVFSVSSSAQSAPLEGNWLGALEVGGGMKLRLVLKITKAADGTFSAKMDSIDQGANDLALDSIVLENKTVRFEAKKYQMSFEGKLDEVGGEISGTFKQGANSLPLIFKRTAVAAKVSRPQDPVKPYPYDEEEVVYENKKDAVKLAGTLTLPRDAKTHPAVILITGSGAQDRNETILGHRPFLVLADYLTRRGIAVLRVDDRGVGGSSIGSSAATSENFAGDVLAGIEFLKTRREINPKQIGLIGHSEGGMIAPMVAARSADAAFLVLMAGTGQTGEDVLYTQMALLEKGAGIAPQKTAREIGWLKIIYSILKTEPDGKRAEQQIRAALLKKEHSLSGGEQKQFAAWRAEAEKQLPILLSAWFHYFVAYDPRPALERVKVPVLAINGENDVQVAPKENLSLIAAALEKGGNKNFTIKSFPKLNHLFQPSETGLPSEYGKIEQTIAPQVLETIGDWILKNTAHQAKKN